MSDSRSRSPPSGAPELRAIVFGEAISVLLPHALQLRQMLGVAQCGLLDLDGAQTQRAREKGEPRGFVDRVCGSAAVYKSTAAMRAAAAADIAARTLVDEFACKGREIGATAFNVVRAQQHGIARIRIRIRVRVRTRTRVGTGTCTCTGTGTEQPVAQRVLGQVKQQLRVSVSHDQRLNHGARTQLGLERVLQSVHVLEGNAVKLALPHLVAEQRPARLELLMAGQTGRQKGMQRRLS